MNQSNQNINSITNKKRRPFDILLYTIVFIFTAFVMTMTVFFVVYILKNGLESISITLLTTSENPIKQTIGILPSIINTGYIILLSVILSVPIGVCSAIYLNEYAKNKKLIKVLEFTIETLSGIPSIIFGVFGYVFFCTLLNLKVSLISGALTLTIMVLPIIIRTTQESLRTVPDRYREGAAGMGATKWYMIRTILLPSASPGIITSVILSIGRIVGESAALILVAGGSAMYMPKGSFFKQIMGSGSTLSVELYRYVSSRGDNETGFAIAALLLTIVIILNMLIKLISKKLNKEGKK